MSIAYHRWGNSQCLQCISCFSVWPSAGLRIKSRYHRRFLGDDWNGVASRQRQGPWLLLEVPLLARDHPPHERQGYRGWLCWFCLIYHSSFFPDFINEVFCLISKIFIGCSFIICGGGHMRTSLSLVRTAGKPTWGMCGGLHTSGGYTANLACWWDERLCTTSDPVLRNVQLSLRGSRGPANNLARPCQESGT